jgi:hypothetical protein
MIEDGILSQIMIESIFALILIAGVFSTPSSTRLRISLLLIAFIAVITRILHKLHHSDFSIVYADNLFAVMALFVFCFLIIHHFLLGNTLLRYRIAAAVAVYLIIGIIWARLYDIIYLVNPHAFSFHETVNPYSLIYFSFVTLLTLGYGDIVPTSIAARSLAILEGITGQLYIVILISSLVSQFSAKSAKYDEIENP